MKIKKYKGDDKKMIDVIYLCGGKGIRTNLKDPKQYFLIDGKPLFMIALEKLNKIDDVRNIIIPCCIDWTSTIEKCIKLYGIKKHVILSSSGISRQESVWNAINPESFDNFNLTKDILIMESVRPYVTKEFIQKVIDIENDFVIPISQSMSTVIDFYGNKYNRDMVGEVQLPQKYDSVFLIECHKKAKKGGHIYTDDAALCLNNSGKKPYVFYGLRNNIKITTREDINNLLRRSIHE